MTAKILDGRAMGAEIKAELRADIEQYVREQGRAPGLVIVRVGGDAASGVYSKALLRVADEVGLLARLEQLPTRTSPDELRALLIQLNCDETVQGIIVQMPLPGHLSQKMVADTVISSKDIDGISPRSAGNLFLGLPSFLPATAAAVMEMLERTNTQLAGRRAVVISRSNVVGKPLAMMLLQRNATVSVCHSRTVNLPVFTRQADILVVNELPGGGIVGDVDFAAVSEVAGAITPTPGGVGPLTNILLLKQCMQAAWQEVRGER